MLALATLGLVAACGPRPTADFRRAAPSFTHDVALPAIGQQVAGVRGEPVSDFNRTDEEEEMHNRIWRFLVAPHAHDWFGDFAIELQRTRITPIGSRAFGRDRYSNWLRETQYQSSTTRYRTLERHALADIDTLPGTFIAICKVIEIDRQRAISVATLSGLGPEAEADTRARKAENDMAIGWFVDALSYRYASYDFALNTLLVETPHENSVAADGAMRGLAPFVERARRGDFCGGAGGGPVAGGHAIPSRYATQMVDGEVVVRK